MDSGRTVDEQWKDSGWPVDGQYTKFRWILSRICLDRKSTGQTI